MCENAYGLSNFFPKKNIPAMQTLVRGGPTFVAALALKVPVKGATLEGVNATVP